MGALREGLGGARIATAGCMHTFLATPQGCITLVTQWSLAVQAQASCICLESSADASLLPSAHAAGCRAEQRGAPVQSSAHGTRASTPRTCIRPGTGTRRMSTSCWTCACVPTAPTCSGAPTGRPTLAGPPAPSQAGCPTLAASLRGWLHALPALCAACLLSWLKTLLGHGVERPHRLPARRLARRSAGHLLRIPWRVHQVLQPPRTGCAGTLALAMGRDPYSRVLTKEEQRGVGVMLVPQAQKCRPRQRPACCAEHGTACCAG